MKYVMVKPGNGKSRTYKGRKIVPLAHWRDDPFVPHNERLKWEVRFGKGGWFSFYTIKEAKRFIDYINKHGTDTETITCYPGYRNKT